jgi:hypothetical protein
MDGVKTIMAAERFALGRRNNFQYAVVRIGGIAAFL